MPPINEDALEANVNAMLGITNEPETETPAPATETQPEQAATETADAEQDDADTSGSDKATGAEKPQAKEAAEPKSPIRPGTLPANNRGDLIDPASGKVIAKAGLERKYYELARNGHAEVQKLRQEMGKREAAIEAYERASHAATSLGLEPQETTVAMQFMSKYKSDPVGAAKELLTDLKARGYTLEELGGQAIDTAAIARMMDERLKPFNKVHEDEARQVEINEQVAAEYQQVSQEFPWISAQDAELSKLLEADPNMTLQIAALKLQSYAYKNGYDLNSSIQAQMSAPAKKPSATPTNRARMTAPSVGNDVAVLPKRSMDAGNNPSSKDIIRQSLAEAGFRLER